jgi:hypothetical protein
MAGFSFSSRPLTGRRPTVRARQQGGYEMAPGVPDANDPVANYGAYAGPSPTHVGSMSSSEHNASMAKRGREKSQAYRDDADKRGGLARVTQGINSVKSGRNWDALAGAMDMFGVDRVRTAAVGGLDMGEYSEDPNNPGTFSRGVNRGFFDRPSMSALQEQRSNHLNAGDINAFLANFQDRRR